MLDITPQAKSCWISVTVLPQTNFSAGRGNKFKITAVMMTRQSALGFFWPEEPAQFMAQDIFTGEFGKEELEMSERLEDRTREGMT